MDEQEESAKTTESAEAQAEVVEETTQVESSTDYEALYQAEKAQNENLKKVVADKDAGLKKYKSIAKGREDWPDDDETGQYLTAEQAQELFDKRLAESELAKSNARLEEINQKALRENKELKLSLANRPSSTPQGAGADNSDAATVEIIPAPLLAKLKAEGKSDEFLDRLRTNIRSGGTAPLV